MKLNKISIFLFHSFLFTICTGRVSPYISEKVHAELIERSERSAKRMSNKLDPSADLT